MHVCVYIFFRDRGANAMDWINWRTISSSQTWSLVLCYLLSSRLKCKTYKISYKRSCKRQNIVKTKILGEINYDKYIHTALVWTKGAIQKLRRFYGGNYMQHNTIKGYNPVKGCNKRSFRGVGEWNSDQNSNENRALMMHDTIARLLPGRGYGASSKGRRARFRRAYRIGALKYLKVV